jgi:hypothetical protein
MMSLAEGYLCCLKFSMTVIYLDCILEVPWMLMDATRIFFVLCVEARKFA